MAAPPASGVSVAFFTASTWMGSVPPYSGTSTASARPSTTTRAVGGAGTSAGAR